jgi:hypothetical protein
MDLMGLGVAYIAQTFSYVPTWCFGTLHMCEHSALPLSFLANKKSSPTIALLFFHHGVPPWACRALFA